MSDLDYNDILERVVRLETNQKHAIDRTADLVNQVAEVKDMLASKIKKDEVKDARFGGVLWAASVMVAAVSTALKIAWEWFHRGG